ncbi:hypothetical protein L3i22_019120 [Actinoplanes sp. L3-i22]|nr:hypothetical protein L3i22_019120 [Actinoplanes sp. L3-i22]
MPAEWHAAPESAADRLAVGRPTASSPTPPATATGRPSRIPRRLNLGSQWPAGRPGSSGVPRLLRDVSGGRESGLGGMSGLRREISRKPFSRAWRRFLGADRPAGGGGPGLGERVTAGGAGR